MVSRKSPLRSGGLNSWGGRHNITLLSVLTGLFVILAYSILDYFFFTASSRSLLEFLFFDVSGHELFVRISITAAFLGFGLFVTRVLSRVRQTERALDISEERFETIADFTPSWENWVDSAGKLLWVNSAIEQFTGYTVSEALAMEDFPILLVHEDDREILRSEFGRAVEGSSGEGLDFRVVRKDGSVFWASASWQPLFDADGKCLGHRSSVRDVSRRKAATEALRHAVEGTAAASGQDFFIKLTQHLAAALDVRYVLIGEITADQSRFQTVAVWDGDGAGQEFEFALDASAYKALVRQAAGQPAEDLGNWLPEGHLLHRMGAKSCLGNPLSDSQGRSVGVLLVLDDKAMDENAQALARSLLDLFAARGGLELERRRAEQELRRSEEKYRVLFERSADALLVIVDGKFVDCNDSTAKMLGYDSREEFLQTHPSQLSPAFQPDGQPSYEKADEMMRMAYENGSHRFEWDHMRSDGEVFPVEVLLTAVPKGDGQILHVVWRDISDRRRAENELRLSEKKYRFLFERSTDAVLVLDEGNCMDCNNATLKLFGCTDKNDILGTSPSEWSPERQSDGRLSSEKAREMMEIAKTQGSHQFEWDQKRKNGEVFPAEVGLTAVPTGDKFAVHTVVRDITGRKRAEEALRFVVESTSASVGEDFFRSMAQNLAVSLGCKYVVVAELIPGQERLTTRFVWNDGKTAPNFEYDLAGTPGENVVGRETCLYSSDVQNEFPDDHMLAQMGVESYLGTPLFDTSGQPLGVLAVMDSEPMNETVAGIGRALTEILAARATAELERVRAETALQESEEKFRLISEQSMLGIIVLQEDVVRYCNQAFSNIFEYPIPEVLGWKPGEIYRVVDGEDRPFVVKQAHKKQRGADAGDIVVNYSWRAVTKSGRSIWVELYSKPVLFEGRSADIVTIVEITERKMAEEAIRKSQQMVQTVLDTIPVRVFWKDRNLVYTGCNRLFAQDAGLQSPDEVVGKTDYDMLWKPVADRYRADDRKVIDAGMLKLGYEEPQTTEDGQTLWLRTSKVPFRDADGNIIGVLGNYEDVTERRKAAVALEKSEATLDGVLQTAPVGIGLLRDWTLQWSNDRLSRISGYSQQEMIEMGPAQLFETEEDFWRVQGVLKHDIKKHGLGTVETTWRRKDGRFVDLMMHFARVHSDKEESDLVFTALDITARKTTENALLETTNELKMERAALDDKNAALKEVLEHLEREKANFKQRVWTDVEQELLPFLDSMRQFSPPEQQAQIDVVVDDLKTLLSQDVDEFQHRYARLTPREREICDLIKDGRSSKEISDQLNVSLPTVHKHRERIRRKLKIMNKDVNLNTYLHFR
ncbi:MAG: PAS domain S-box protein [bacterium]|nr:PAS domain S-box protein [bacterium]